MEKIILLILLPTFFITHFSRAQKLQKTEHLNLNASGISHFEVEVGSGSLKITGSDETETIEVQADIDLRGVSDDEFDKYVILSLQRNGSRGKLEVKLKNENGFLKNRVEGTIDITINMPEKMDLTVSDGSGDIHISSMAGNVTVHDGSGEMDVRDIAGNVTVNDGSGNLKIDSIKGEASVSDGSGNIEIFNMAAGLKINDGSGEITIRDIAGEITVNDGSGSIHIKNTGNKITISDGSGLITANNVAGDVIILSSGSGETRFSNIGGKIVMN